MKINMVKIITILSVVATVMWVGGLFLTIDDQFFKNPTPPAPTASALSSGANQTKGISIVALGDSLTRGTGDSTGKGYVQYMLDELKSNTKQKVELSNLAIKGFTSQQLLKQLEQKEIQSQLSDSNLIVMTIGANDLFQGGESLSHLDQSIISSLEKNYLGNLKKIFDTIRIINPEATVFHVGIYNPFIELPNSEKTSEAVRRWNFVTADLAASYKKIVVVPTFDLFEINVNNNLSSDKFHPNSNGYKLVGNRVAALINFEKENKQNE
ncbi:SGNH/GDSL hydrolase family protein [Paenisporosarcina sp. NPDC076898]|uniref:SGNH/GDSL hydrolase family protein n=1 Tax=unclassified Paenisporosarcina TaxID=2642018 RepID=UPI003D047A20